MAYGIARGFAPWEKSLLALAWFMPLVARVTAMEIGLPIGWLVMLVIFADIVGRGVETPAIAKHRAVRPRAHHSHA